MDDNKPWYQSKTIWGSLIMLASLALPAFGLVSLTPDQQSMMVNNIVGVVDAVLGLIGGILAIYGRFTAKTTIGKK